MEEQKEAAAFAAENAEVWEKIEAGVEKSPDFFNPEEFKNSLLEAGLKNYYEAFVVLEELAKRIGQNSGRALLVGGCVRDIALKLIPKDLDIEVYNLGAEKIEEIAADFGSVSQVGKSFGVLKLRLENGLEIDIALPRLDSKVAAGHQGFEVELDPCLPLKDAARRRDFTLNAMLLDPVSGELYDPFNGKEDLKRRILRVTDPERFKDDPLRVMRALQFVGRMGLSIAPESVATLQEMIPKLKAEISRERIAEEWRKLFLKSPKPSLGLAAGMALGVFAELYPDFPPLRETVQDRRFHPEGDVWTHTLMSVDEAAKVLRYAKVRDEDEKLTIMLAVLCHDLGKPSVIGKAPGLAVAHAAESETLARKFLEQLITPKMIAEKAAKLVAFHSYPEELYLAKKEGRNISGSLIKLAREIFPATIFELALVDKSNRLGRGPFEDPNTPRQFLLPEGFIVGDWLLAEARKLEILEKKPGNLISGKELEPLGMKPGKEMGQIIKLGNRFQEEKNLTREEFWAAIKGMNAPKEIISKLEEWLKKE